MHFRFLSKPYPPAAVLLALFSLLVSGCMLPPDVIPSPNPGPAPDIERESALSGADPVPSIILDAAYENPDDHNVRLLETGDDAMLARIHLIRSARTSIDLQTFIWVYDRSGAWIYWELLQAARRGVRVRILVDQFMAPGVTPDEYAGLTTAHENIEVRLYRPLTVNAINKSFDVIANTFTRFTTMNQRMHNKVLLIDDKVAIIGGRNIQDAYFDRDPGLSFRDRDIIISGPSAREVQDSFHEFWNYEETFEASRMHDLKAILEAGTELELEDIEFTPDPVFAEIDELANTYDISSERPRMKNWSVGRMIFRSDHPRKNPKMVAPHRMAPFKEAGDMIVNAESEILVQSPYAVINEKTYKDWKKLRKESDVTVKFSTNSLSSADHVYVGSIALKQRRRQVKALGVGLYLAKPVPEDILEMVPRYEQLKIEKTHELHPDWEASEDVMPLEGDDPRFCIHAKTMVIDRKVSLVGSHNFDPRSSNLNTECVVLVYDKPFSEHLAGIVDLSFKDENSWVVAERDSTPIIGDLNNLLSKISTSLPILDIWPIEHISCFELKEGMEPLSPFDENFHEHYEDVGPFPGLDTTMGAIEVRLIRAIGGPAASLM